jgi:hypothetical protein
MRGAHKLGNDISDRGLSMSGVFLVRPFGGITFYLEKLNMARSFRLELSRPRQQEGNLFFSDGPETPSRFQ